MSDNPNQIYSATYSNVPVFEFVTDEGPIMRRKSDSWINATHILKIAKFPKARRTRILEKDVQTGIHEKVQGGYGKYQGTYVPLNLGAEIAKTFGVFDILRPIFEFEYVEGKTETPPPAPKHNHASASNVARRQQQQQRKAESALNDDSSAKRMKVTVSEDTAIAKRRGRPKRVALTARGKPGLQHSRTAPTETSGPSMGTFNARRESSYSQSLQLPPLMRQDTERDALQVMASNLNVNREDLEAESSDNDNHDSITLRPDFVLKDTDEDDLMTGKELFGSRDTFATRESFEKIVHMHNRNSRNVNVNNAPHMLSLNGSISGDGYNLSQYNHNNHFTQSPTTSIRGDPESVEYFNTLLNFFLEDEGSPTHSAKGRNGNLDLPEAILNPPQPLNKININQAIDNDGNTIFHWACSMANISMIEFLLSIFSNFIDSQVKNYHGETPLMFLIQFNNSYQMKNFPAIFDLLFDSILSVDNYGRTVLHHIVLACTGGLRLSRGHIKDDESRKKKERFSKYYMDVVFAKIIEFPDYQILQGNQSRSLEDKKELIAKFINHQDNEGNTAFHLAAYNLTKKLIKIFIAHHKYIDFGLRNLVNYTVEDYLASHNYVLRLENGKDELVPTQEDKDQIQPTLYPAEHSQSFESQLHKTNLAINLQNSTANLITEKLSELAYAIDKELGEKDEKLRELYKVFQLIAYDKFRSQRAILEIFNLDNLVEDIEKDFESSTDDMSKSGNSEALVIDGSRDKIIQDEISRLQNDLLFQYLSVKEDVDSALKRYGRIMEILASRRLNELDRKFMGPKEEDESDNQRLELATELQKEILKRIELSARVYEEGSKVPVLVQNPDEFKENRDGDEHKDGNNSADKEVTYPQSSEAGTKSTIADFPQVDKLYKYCKLISLSCGMSFSEVENSIDLIEQSLERSVSNSTT